MAETFQIDNTGVTRHLADGRVESLAWVDLERVTVQTSSDGPVTGDLFFILRGSGGTGCVIPQDANISGELLTRLQRLPGFDNRQVAKAMSSTEDAVFICWERGAQPG